MVYTEVFDIADIIIIIFAPDGVSDIGHGVCSKSSQFYTGVFGSYKLAVFI